MSQQPTTCARIRQLYREALQRDDQTTAGQIETVYLEVKELNRQMYLARHGEPYLAGKRWFDPAWWRSQIDWARNSVHPRQAAPMVSSSVYDAELDRGYRWFNYHAFYAWLGNHAGDVVEVGSWKGFSTSFLARHKHQLHDRHGYSFGKVYAVDVWDGKGAYWPDFRQRFPVDTAEHLFRCFGRNIERSGAAAFVEPLRMTSLAAAEKFRQECRTFGAVFIDGDHSYQAVCDDITAWRSRVQRGGVLAGHDYDNPTVRRAVDELVPGAQVWQPGNVWFTFVT